MTDAEQNFIYCIKNLESFNADYLQARKDTLIGRNEQTVQSTPVISAHTSSSEAEPTAPEAVSVVIDDYVRTCRMYCVMLWTYCDTVKLNQPMLKELELIRHCIIHHDADMARYRSAGGTPKNPTLYSDQGESLILMTNGKSYVQGYSLIISDSDLVTFTELVKSEFTAKTGFTF